MATDAEAAPELDLEGQTAIVTGAGAGLGREISYELADAGAAVVLCDISARGLAETEETVRDRGAEALSVEADVSSAERCRAVVAAAVDRYRRIDALVNNAGIASYGPSETFSIDEWNRHLDVMLSGTFFMSQAVAASMLAAGRGSIVNIASITGMAGWPMRAAYGAAKAGIISLTQTLATEWGPRGIRVNSVSPGVIHTELVDEAVRSGVADLDRYRARVPSAALGRPADIARPVRFLLSQRTGGGISGVNLRIDGGWVPWANPQGRGFPEEDAQ